MKNVRLIVLACLALISLISIIYPLFSPSEGVLVTSIGDNSACKDVITIGSVIKVIDDKTTLNVNEFREVTRDLGGFITLIINNNPRSCFIPENSTLDIAVRNTGPRGLRFGTDIGEGVFYTYKSKEDISTEDLQDILVIIESRIDKYKLINTDVKIVNNSIQIFTDSTEEEYINYLVERGILKAEFFHEIKIIDNVGELSFNDKTYEIITQEESILVNNSEYKINQYFELDGLDFQVKNITKNTTELSMVVFDEQDLSLPKTNINTRYSRITKQDNNYVFIINTELRDSASEDFEKATKGREITISPAGESFLKEPIIITIDDEPVISLPVSGINAGKKIEEFVIWGFRPSSEEAAKDMLRIISIIETKRMPVKLILTKTGLFESPSSDFFKNISLYVPLFVLLFTGSLFFIRYKKRITPVILLFVTILCELLIIIGTVNLSWLSLLVFLLGVSTSLIKAESYGWLYWLTIFLMLIMSIGASMNSWVINASFIFGILVFTMVSSCLTFIMMDKILTGKISFSQNEYKNSSQKITKNIAIVIGLAFILFFIGNAFKAFSLAIFVGSLTVITITKPIYYNMLSRSKKFT
jgi:hypothetical protein